jgi:hypothetical protein
VVLNLPDLKIHSLFVLGGILCANQALFEVTAQPESIKIIIIFQSFSFYLSF